MNDIHDHPTHVVTTLKHPILLILIAFWSSPHAISTSHFVFVITNTWIFNLTWWHLISVWEKHTVFVKKHLGISHIGDDSNLYLMTMQYAKWISMESNRIIIVDRSKYIQLHVPCVLWSSTPGAMVCRHDKDILVDLQNNTYLYILIKLPGVTDVLMFKLYMKFIADSF